MQLTAVRLSESLSAQHTTAADSDDATSTAATHAAHSKPKAKLGRDIVQDFQTLSIGQSAYFTGAPAAPEFTKSVC